MSNENFVHMKSFFSLWSNNLATVISSSDLEYESPLRFC